MKRCLILFFTLCFFAHISAQNDSISSIMQNARQGQAYAQNEVGAWYYQGKHVKQDYAQALQWWAKSAQQGNVNAIGNMGLCYQYGRGIAKDSLMALQLYMKSIEMGNQSLFKERIRFADKKENFNCILIALCYQRGLGIQKNVDKAIAYYTLAAQNNSVDGQRELGLCLLNQRKEGQAAPWFKKAANHQDLIASYYYGRLLMQGKGVEKDEQQAVIYWLQAAENGFIQAQYELGKLYLTGRIVPINTEQAVEWFNKAATKGSAHAQWELALCYINGIGINRDYHQALYWLGKASSKGYIRSFEKYCTSSEEGWKGTPFFDYLQGMYYYVIEHDIETAFKCFKKVDKKKIIEGKTMLGVCYADSNYSKHKPKKAVKTLLKASETDRVAIYQLAILYEKNNYTQTLELLQKSSEKGYAIAQCYLGDIYFEGRGIEQDYAKAVILYQQAEAQGQLTANAIKRYATCYENGWGNLPQDKKKARSLLKAEEKDTIKRLLSSSKEILQSK